MKVPQRCHPRWAAGLAAIVLAASPATSRAAQPASTPAPVAPAPAPTTTEPAPSPSTGGPDEVALKNGGFVRGTVVELMPDQHVVIVPDGSSERRTIAWSEVERVERGKHAAPAVTPTPAPAPEPTPPAEPAAAMPTTPPPEESSGTRIHIETTSDREVTLHEIESELYASGYYSSLRGMAWKNVCVAPCDRVVDGSRGQDFFVTTKGSLITASRRMKFTDDGRDVTLEVKPGNGPMRVIGVTLASLGAGLLVGGALLVALDTTRKFGIGMLAVGAPSLIVGIPLTVLGRTRVKKR